MPIWIQIELRKNHFCIILENKHMFWWINYQYWVLSRDMPCWHTHNMQPHWRWNLLLCFVWLWHLSIQNWQFCVCVCVCVFCICVSNTIPPKNSTFNCYIVYIFCCLFDLCVSVFPNEHFLSFLTLIKYDHQFNIDSIPFLFWLPLSFLLLW